MLQDRNFYIGLAIGALAAYFLIGRAAPAPHRGRGGGHGGGE